MAINKLNLNGTVYDIGEAEGTDTQESICSFTSGDNLSPTSFDDSVALVSSGETHRSLWEKASTMIKNIRYLGKMLGSTSISSLGDGTVTGALNTLNTQIDTLNSDLSGKAPTSHASSATTYGVGSTSNYGHCMTINNLTTSSHTNGYALSAYQGYLLNTNKSNTITVRYIDSSQISVPANDQVDTITIGSTTYSGYTAIGAVGAYVDNGDSGVASSWCNVYAYWTSNNTVYASIRNYYSGQASVRIRVAVLYVKNS